MATSSLDSSLIESFGGKDDGWIPLLAVAPVRGSGAPPRSSSASRQSGFIFCTLGTSDSSGRCHATLCRRRRNDSVLLLWRQCLDRAPEKSSLSLVRSVRRKGAATGSCIRLVASLEASAPEEPLPAAEAPPDVPGAPAIQRDESTDVWQQLLPLPPTMLARFTESSFEFHMMLVDRVMNLRFGYKRRHARRLVLQEPNAHPSDIAWDRAIRLSAYLQSRLQRGTPSDSTQQASVPCLSSLRPRAPILKGLIAGGREFEQTLLEALRQHGHEVVCCHSVAETLRAMEAGVAIIAQAPLEHGTLHGRSDLLVREWVQLGDQRGICPADSPWNPWEEASLPSTALPPEARWIASVPAAQWDRYRLYRYTVAECKLARKAQPQFTMQAMAYLWIVRALERRQEQTLGYWPRFYLCLDSESDAVVAQVQCWRTADCSFYFEAKLEELLSVVRREGARLLKTNLAELSLRIAESASSLDMLIAMRECRRRLTQNAYAACALERYHQSPLLVTEMRLHDMRQLWERGFRNLEQLASLPAAEQLQLADIPPWRLSEYMLQARLLLQRYRHGDASRLPYEPRPHANAEPARLLPPASPYDMYIAYMTSYDGSYFLLGIWCPGQYARPTSFWAYTPEEATSILRRFLVHVRAALFEDPQLHVYHFGELDRHALMEVALATHDAGVQATVDQLPLVDLRQVVRASFLIGDHDPYNLRSLNSLIRGSAIACSTIVMAPQAEATELYERYRIASRYNNAERARIVRNRLLALSASICRSLHALAGWLRTHDHVYSAACAGMRAPVLLSSSAASASASAAAAAAASQDSNDTLSNESVQTGSDVELADHREWRAAAGSESGARRCVNVNSSDAGAGAGAGAGAAAATAGGNGGDSDADDEDDDEDASGSARFRHAVAPSTPYATMIEMLRTERAAGIPERDAMLLSLHVRQRLPVDDPMRDLVDYILRESKIELQHLAWRQRPQVALDRDLYDHPDVIVDAIVVDWDAASPETSLSASDASAGDRRRRTGSRKTSIVSGRDVDAAERLASTTRSQTAPSAALTPPARLEQPMGVAGGDSVDSIAGMHHDDNGSAGSGVHVQGSSTSTMQASSDLSGSPGAAPRVQYADQGPDLPTHSSASKATRPQRKKLQASSMNDPPAETPARPDRVNLRVCFPAEQRIYSDSGEWQACLLIGERYLMVPLARLRFTGPDSASIQVDRATAERFLPAGTRLPRIVRRPPFFRRLSSILGLCAAAMHSRQTPLVARYLRRECPFPTLVASDEPFRTAEQVPQVVESLRQITDGRVLVIQGPPGCGKTHTIAECIAELVLGPQPTGRHRFCIGVCASSHAAIDQALGALVQRLRLRGCTHTAALIWRIGQHKQCSLPTGAVHVTTRVPRMAPTSSEADPPFSVLAGTAFALSHEHLRERLDYLFVDEAGQMARAYFVAMLPNVRRAAVLVGDQMQLAAVSANNSLLPSGRPLVGGESSLTYLLGADTSVAGPAWGWFLPTTHRLCPELCRFIGTTFYQGRLRWHARTEQHQVWDHHLGRARSGLGFLAVDVSSSSSTATFPGSATVRSRWKREVATVLRLVAMLVQGTRFELRLGPQAATEQSAAPRHVSVDDILIVAPYNEQVNALKTAFTLWAASRTPQTGADAASSNIPRIGTVDKFQGQERPIVIMSLCAPEQDRTAASGGDAEMRTRASHEGIAFILDARRLNVALSRAQCLAVVVGERHLGLGTVDDVQAMKAMNLFLRLRAEAEPWMLEEDVADVQFSSASSTHGPSRL